MQAIRETHLQEGSIVRTAAHCQENGRPTRRQRGLQDHPLGVGTEHLMWTLSI